MPQTTKDNHLDTTNAGPIEEKALIVAASSDIGHRLGMHWLSLGIKVSGTFLHDSPNVQELRAAGAELHACDLKDSQSVELVISQVAGERFSRIVLAAGTQEPIGLFGEVPFRSWKESLEINLLGQLQILHHFLSQNSIDGSRVLMFAGGGTNNATKRYSAYTIAKISSIKIIELLAFEYPKTFFSIIGPGWVDTKIHRQTLANPLGAGENFERTVAHIEDNDFFPMERLVECIDWLFDERGDVVTGRNFSAVHDHWGSQSLRDALLKDPNLYKLRRFGNDLIL